MTMKKLAMACLAALGALAMTGCGDPKCDPECGAGFTCNTKVDPPKCEATGPQCNPACSAGQTCDTTKNPPVCVTPVNDCNPKCGAGFTCDKTKTPAVCVEKKCDPACADGQECDTTKNPPVCVTPDPCGSPCPSGTKCDTTANPPKCECFNISTGEMGCPAGQRCDAAVPPATCKEICNPPFGCGDLEMCDEASGQCLPMSCNGTQCESGQGCYNPGNPNSTNNKVCTCLPDGNILGIGDTCLDYGMICDPTTRKCTTPGEWDDCNPNAETPCSEGLDCIDYNGDGQTVVCIKPCTTNSDCGNDTSTWCVPNDPRLGDMAGHCDDNLCGIPEMWGEQYRDYFFQKCPANGAGENLSDPETWTGTCVPFPYQLGTRLITLGLCLENGTAPQNGACDPDAGREAMDHVCGFNQLCDQVQPTTADQLGGLCITMCNAGTTPTPELGCEAQDAICNDVSGVPAAQNPKTHIGFCNTGCEIYGEEACPDDALGNHQGCWFTPKGNNEGYCKALLPEAGGVGSPCTYPEDENDNREPCGDRTICLSEQGATVGECFGFCNMSSCTDDTVTCGACAGTVCCMPTCPANYCGDDGCGGTCGCAEGEVCDSNTCCTPSCAGKCNGESDGCGGTCGCDEGMVCDTTATPNACVTCTPNCDGKCSGEADGCGGTCTCAPGTTCDTAATPNACVACTANCDGKCNGESDGCGGTCGCESGFICDTQATPNACVACTADCAGKCNGEADGCGGTCGCEAGQICDTAATPNACVTCTADCTGKCNGESDGCGGTCGCTGTDVCNNGTCGACVPQCDGKECGDDGCGGQCGTGCAAGEKCSPAGTCEVCVPNCRFKACGDDGCGGTCGNGCAEGAVCKTVGADQVCYNLLEATPPQDLGTCVPNE